MAAKSRRIANLNGATIGPLNQVAYIDSSKALINATIKSAPKDQKAVTNDILAAIKQMIYDSGKYQLKIDAKVSDVLMGRIASLLDEVKESFVKNELEDIKNDILNEISGLSIENVLKNFLLDQITELFDDDAKKEDIIELKKWMQQNLITSGKSASDEVIQLSTKTLENEQQTEKPLEEEKDEEKGDFKDSTPANNFYTLYSFIQKQFDILNENMKNIPGQSGILSKTTAFIKNGFLNTVKKISSIGKNMKSITSRIGKLGSGVGGMIATPFKKIGNLFSSLNPFKGKKDGKKQALRDKLLSAIEKILNKLWKIVEPFVSMVTKFIWMAIKTVVIPIAIIVAKVLLIAAAITLLGVGLYLAYRWIKKKIAEWIEYFKSGKWWKDLKAKMLDAWEWIRDFGKWIQDKLVDFGKTLWDWYLAQLKFVFIDILVWVGKKIAEFGVWIWNKLLEFGKWLYDNYIYKYIVQPFKQYIWEPVKMLWNEKIWPTIEPFVKSLTELKDKIVKAFSAWDTNKSIWENLKNMTSIIKDAVVEWWDTSPFKTLWDQSVWPMIKMFIDELTKLKNTLLGVFKGWDTNKPFLENLVGLGTAIVSAMKKWWTESELKKLYDKHVQPLIDKALAYLNDLLKPIRDWYDKSDLKKWIDTITEKINAVLGKVETAKKAVNAIKSPFKTAGGWLKKTFSSTENTNAASAEVDKINAYTTNINRNDVQSVNMKITDSQRKQSANIAFQQAQNIAQPIQSIYSINNNESTTLQKTSQEMSESMQQKENDSSQFNEEQSMKTDKLIDMMNMFMPQVLKKLDDPQKIPVVIPYQTDYATNNANMQAF